MILPLLIHLLLLLLLLLLQLQFVFLAEHTEGETCRLLAGLVKGGVGFGGAVLGGGISPRIPIRTAILLSTRLRRLDIPAILCCVIFYVNNVGVRGGKARVHLELLA